MNRRQLIVVWLLAAWLAFAFFWAARHVEQPGVMDRASARLKGEPPPPPTVTYRFVWDRDAGTFLMLAVPAIVIAVPLVLTLGRKK